MPDSTGVVIHGRAGCGYCSSAKEYLDGAGIPYSYIEHDDASKALVYAQYGMSTVPVVVINGDLVGGFMDLLRMGAHRVGKALVAVPTEAVAA